MKSLRKSLNSNKDSIRAQISTPLPQVSKPIPAVAPPQKVIRALQGYRPQAPQELGFQKGDFFYVLRDDPNNKEWYEANNPVSGARGLVPRSLFEESNKNLQAGTRAVSQLPSSSRIPPPPIPFTPKAKAKIFYAVVLHDFQAERPDELEAKQGDAISVVAQSNREWYVAKPIDRVGRPGLIPASFVEIRDPATGAPVEDIETLMDRGDLPKVEDWKRAVSEYKQNSIALGVIDAPSQPNRYTSPAPTTTSIYSQQPPPPKPPVSEGLLPGILLSCDVVSFHHEMDDYWFRLDAVYQPYAQPAGSRLPPAKRLVLFRVYNDFYDFQVSLLATFPKEAGREPPEPRILPFMPGPAEDVDQELTETRRGELNEYLHKLCDLNQAGNKYILEHSVVRGFLSLKPGDVESEIEPRQEEVEQLAEFEYARRQAEENGYPDQLDGREEYSEVRDQLGQMRVNGNGGDRSDGSDYEDEGYASQQQHKGYDAADRHPYQQYDQRRPSDGNLSSRGPKARLSSASSLQRDSRSGSPYDHHDASGWADQSYNSTSYDRSKVPQLTSSPSTSSVQSSLAPSFTSGRSRSQSNATSNISNLNTPPISAANQSAAFVKIKIFDRVSDDLIAIRVHPRVSHAELVDKVQARLGGEVLHLKYRDSLRNDLIVIQGDQDLRDWMDGTDKYVLYAD